MKKLNKKFLALCLVTALAATPSMTGYASTYGPKYNVVTTVETDTDNKILTITMNGTITGNDAPTKGYWYALLNGETIAESKTYETDNENRQRMTWNPTPGKAAIVTDVTSPIFGTACTYSCLETWTAFTLVITITNPNPNLTGIGLKLSGVMENSGKMTDSQLKYAHVETGCSGYDVTEEVALLNAPAEDPEEPDDPDDPVDPDDPDDPVSTPVAELDITVRLPLDHYKPVFGTPAFRFLITDENEHSITVAFIFDGDEDTKESNYVITKELEIEGNSFTIKQLNMSRYAESTNDEEEFDINDGDLIEITYDEALVNWEALSYSFTEGEL